MPLSLLLAVLFSLSVSLLTSAPFCAAQPANVSSTALTSDLPVLGSLPANATAYYSFVASAVANQQTALISVSASIGSATLYVSLSEPMPSASSFDYQASWQTGGVVSVTSPQSPYTAYVAVVSSLYSRCNYSLLVTAYDTAAKQSTPIPLSSAQPLASAIAAGEYRYFTYNQSITTAAFWSTAVALTETYGQCRLLINSPNVTGLPSLSSYEYSYDWWNYPLVALLEPAAGVWTIGVWSNASSAFSIIAAGDTATQPMELGVTYPGFVQLSMYRYYSVYLDPLLLAANINNSAFLDIELLSLTGDGDLYCSETYDKPTSSNNRWSSTNPSGALDRISVPTAQLSAGTVYCGVIGYIAASYTFSASYNSASLLAAGEDSDSAECGQQRSALLVGVSSRHAVCDGVCGGGRGQPRADLRSLRRTADTQQLDNACHHRHDHGAAVQSDDGVWRQQRTGGARLRPTSMPAASAGEGAQPVGVSHSGVHERCSRGVGCGRAGGG